MKRVALGTVSLTMIAGLVPGAHAAQPGLAGSILLGPGPNGPSCVDAGCAAFFAAGCPDAMTHDDGATESIVDVSGYAGQQLTFSWRDDTTRLHDATGYDARGLLAFYVRTACTKPTEFSEMFSLGTSPDSRNVTYTLPQNAKWLVVVAQEGASAASWEAA